MLVNLLTIILGLSWLGGWFFCLVQSGIAFSDGEPKRGIIIGAIGLALFSVPVAYAMSVAEDDPHANQLCVSGRQKWVTTSTGKGGQETHKEWICSQWE